MFSTLLGRLPLGRVAGDGSGPDEADDVDVATDPTFILHALATTGLELLATGTAAAPDADADDVVRTWQAAAAATDRPVKQVLAGPYSAGRDGPRTRPIQLAERLRETILALAGAGCPFVEIDEPEALAITVVDGERQRFVEAHRTLVDGIDGLHLSLALTGGNLDAAGPATFFDRPYASYAFDLIAGPDNWRLVAAAPQDRGIVCGAMDSKPGGDESKELLVWAAHYAASTSGRGTDRVGLANAPSLAGLSWEVALRKLTRLAEAAAIAGLKSPDEVGRRLDPRAFGGRRDRPNRVRFESPDPE